MQMVFSRSLNPVGIVILRTNIATHFAGYEQIQLIENVRGKPDNIVIVHIVVIFDFHKTSFNLNYRQRLNNVLI